MRVRRFSSPPSLTDVLICPRCSSPLLPRALSSGQHWRCRCGGGFVLLGAARSLLARRVVDALWKEAIWGTPAAGCRCPSSAKPMAESVVVTLRIDVCRRCQALRFDHREIAALPPRLEPPDRPLPADPLRERAIMQVTEMQRRYQQGEASGGAPDDIWKKVVGVLGLPVEIGAMVTAAGRIIGQGVGRQAFRGASDGRYRKGAAVGRIDMLVGQSAR